MVGISLGIPVGMTDGIKVGTMLVYAIGDGTVVGVCRVDGRCVGMSVGLYVSILVGINVGTAVGMIVGS